MLKHIRVTMIGGDERSLAMAERLTELGAHVTSYAMGALPKGTAITAASTPEEAMASVQAVVLPMPAFDAQLCVPCPRAAAQPLSAAALLSLVGSGTPVFGGRISPAAFALACDLSVRMSDYALSDEVLIRNAVPTAEGAIALAMQALDVTVHGARVAVIGFGRIGFALATRLRALGAHVTVAARKPRDLARAEGIYCRSYSLNGQQAVADLVRDGYDVIFNTVPYPLISNDVLQSIPPATVLVELASAPGGWDASARVSCKTVYAPGLPAKCAPRTAGIILADGLATMLGEVL